MKFRKKPVVIDATQWFKNGDHGNVEFPYSTGNCSICDGYFQDHGWINTLEGGHIVCPGDWIITGVNGEHYPCKPEIFEKTYERVD